MLQCGIDIAILCPFMEIQRLFVDPGGSYFLFGPRGTGKSTWLATTYPSAPRIDLLAPETQRSYEARPERLREYALAHRSRKVLIIDEVQRVPALLDVVHQLIEERCGLRFVMTGSSARTLRRAGTNLLAGRAQSLSLHPFMAAELGRSFDLERAVGQGLVPLIWSAREPERALAAYLALYVQEEVRLEGLVRNVGNFQRFLEAVSFSHAASLNVSAVSRDCEVSRKTVEGFVEILSDLLLCFLVPVFTKRARRELVAHPKFYWFDAGVFRSIRPAGPLDSPHEIAGPALEGLVAQHLRAWIDYGRRDLRLFYWQTRAGLEVDFVVYGRDGFHAIEVKNGARVRPEETRSLRAFHEDYPGATRVLVYRGRERLTIDGIECLPCDEFLRALVPGRPMPGGE